MCVKHIFKTMTWLSESSVIVMHEDIKYDTITSVTNLENIFGPLVERTVYPCNKIRFYSSESPKSPPPLKKYISLREKL